MRIVDAPHLPVRPDWFALRDEPALEPVLAIVDAHHHVWDRQTGRHLADEFGSDVNSGHRGVSTVNVQCRSMLREQGPDAIKPVGEVAFANGIAAMFASGAYGPARCCDAIVGFIALLTTGALAPTAGGFVQGLATTIVAFAAAAVVVFFVPERRGKALS